MYLDAGRVCLTCRSPATVSKVDDRSHITLAESGAAKTVVSCPYMNPVSSDHHRDCVTSVIGDEVEDFTSFANRPEEWKQPSVPIKLIPT